MRSMCVTWTSKTHNFCNSKIQNNIEAIPTLAWKLKTHKKMIYRERDLLIVCFLSIDVGSSINLLTEEEYQTIY